VLQRLPSPALRPGPILAVNSGMPVLMPWASQVDGVTQVRLPGKAFGDACRSWNKVVRRGARG
jgi:hypothetical protein